MARFSEQRARLVENQAERARGSQMESKKKNAQCKLQARGTGLVREHSGKVNPSGSSYSSENLYPMPQTVSTIEGFSGLSSILARRRLI